ncbi:MAG: sel1 repeat family protein [Deltaproteobacteria bacterium]|jgi:TPR repeat protein|nr:sel1 repeat family protein [Deltaproteobacteria bacterium]
MRLRAFIFFIFAGLILGPTGPTLAAPPARAAKTPTPSPTAQSPVPLDYEFESLKKEAVAGDAEAQFVISQQLMVWNLETVKDPAKKKENFLEALQWLRRSADQEYPRAMTALGEIYEYGSKKYSTVFGISDKGVNIPRDKAEARRWYQKAADLKELEAMIKLATFCATGVAGPKDPVAAQKLIQMARDKAVSQNNKDILPSLAEIYEKGHIVPKDLAMAIKLYDQAAKLGSFEAKAKYDEMRAKGQPRP